ncbi:MAG: tetraacyldisaccharide 4'-kinase [Syntrophaceae bacterium]
MLKLRQKILQVWSGKESGGFLIMLLSGISVFYSLALSLRNFCFKSGFFKTRRLGCKVISIGNITVGGTGKTPMAIMIAEFLKSKGFRPAVLSRGYGGESTGKTNIVSDGKQLFGTPDQAGDEPCLIAGILEDVPVLTNADRYAAGKIAVEKLGADVLILDDGFQHRCLHRDIDIALLDAARPFGNGFVLPRGPLREQPGSLERADLLVLTRSDSDSVPCETMLRKQFPRKKIVRARHEPECVVDHSTGEDRPVSFISGKRVAAFCGIAGPGSFRALIEKLGGELVFFKEFPDHHRYTPQDIDYLIGKSRDKSPDIVLTTDKDRIKLGNAGFPGLFTLRIKMEIDNPEFSGWLLAGLSR